MKVLIAPQFNSSMPKLSSVERSEVAHLFSLVSSLSREELLATPLITKLAISEGDLYTLRTTSTRVFCTFDASGDLIFVDVASVREPRLEVPKPIDKEVTLFGPKGNPVAYIATDDENTIYSFDGQPFAYLDGDSIYGFNGEHLGWFEEGIVWDHQGKRVGSTSAACPAFTKFEPFKGFKRFKPFKSFKKYAPYKPYKSFSNSGQELLGFLRQGQQ